MREELDRLVQLQELDHTVRNLKTGKAKFAAEAADADRKAEAAKQEMQNRATETASFRRAMDKRELDLRDLEARIAKFQGQLNLVKTNKEYTALQHEIMGLKADKSKIEDEILKMLDQIEADQKDVKTLEARAKEAAESAAKRKEAIRLAIEDADARLQRLQAERSELAASIPSEFLGPYDRLLQKSDGRAMAPCRSFVCGACRMSLTANTVNLLMAGERLIYCHSCGRILYLPPGETPS